VIFGGLDGDRLVGGAGDDRIDGGDGRNRVFGGSGRDAIDAANGSVERINAAAAATWCGPTRVIAWPVTANGSSGCGW
jgi:Ca2+-binding RTX toxin-like protein